MSSGAAVGCMVGWPWLAKSASVDGIVKANACTEGSINAREMRSDVDTAWRQWIDAKAIAEV